jgi:hypothetical protein
MAKPSIFSREYERHRRRRKKVIAFTVIFIIAAAGIFISSGSIKKKIISMAGAYKNVKIFSVFEKEKKEEIAPSNAQESLPPVQPKSNTEQPVKDIAAKGYDIPLSDGTTIRAVYESRDGVNRFQYILPVNAPASFNINPSGSAMVIMDSAVQSMLLVDINGNLQDITNTKYTYKNTEENKTVTFKKDDVLEKHKETNYIWCTSPKFIDDENIAYLSQLPHVNTKITTKFFWAVNIKNKDRHDYIYSLKGENLKLGNISEKGIEVILDNGTIKFAKLVGGKVKIIK